MNTRELAQHIFRWGASSAHLPAERFKDEQEKAIKQVKEAIRTQVKKETEELVKLSIELHALVIGESPQLLNEDSGGDGNLCCDIEDAIERFKQKHGENL